VTKVQQKTYYPKAAEIQRDWVVMDAEGQNLGRFAARIAHILLGKHKPTFTPGVEMGDFVVVVNTEKVTVTGTRTHSKLESKIYYSHSVIRVV
jgi:large subunit ribosomal protein L13